MLGKAEASAFSIKKQFEAAESYVVDCKGEYFTEGLLYYNTNKRKELLKSAESLCYSKEKIEHLRSLDGENWNADNVKLEDIKDWEDLEKFVKDKSPWWKDNILTKIGDLALR